MSNYIAQLSHKYSVSNRYDPIAVRGKYTGFNTATLTHGNRSNPTSYTDSESIKYLTSIQDGAKQLSAALKGMTDEATFNKMAAVSSDKDALATTATSSPTKDFQEQSVGIRQLATAQVNTGGDLKAEGTYSTQGQQKFEIEINGKKTRLEIEVKAGDTNKMVQQKMADAINGAGLGVVASVSAKSASGTSALTVSSKNTGGNAKNIFSIRDLQGGTLVANTGAANTTQYAQNAIYTVDGQERTSESNLVDLGNGVSALLKKETGSETVRITSEVNNSYAAGKLQEIVNSYNRLLETAQTKTNGNTRLKTELLDAARTYLPTLQRFGITQDASGKLAADQAALSKAAEDGSLQREFTYYEGKNFGFASRLSNIARNVESSPAQYVTRTSEQALKYDAAKSYEENLNAMMASPSFSATRFYRYDSASSLLGLMFNIYA